MLEGGPGSSERLNAEELYQILGRGDRHRAPAGECEGTLQISSGLEEQGLRVSF